MKGNFQTFIISLDLCQFNLDFYETLNLRSLWPNLSTLGKLPWMATLRVGHSLIFMISLCPSIWFKSLWNFKCKLLGSQINLPRGYLSLWPKITSACNPIGSLKASYFMRGQPKKSHPKWVTWSGVNPSGLLLVVKRVTITAPEYFVLY